jgi:6-phosphofructokinase 1
MTESRGRHALLLLSNYLHFLLGGADAVYTREDGVHMDTVQRDVTYLRRKFRSFNNAVIVRNERCSEHLTMPVMQSLFEDEGERPGHPSFATRTNVLGHLQQGNAPSCLDRVRATRLASAAVQFILRQCELPAPDANSIVVTGIAGPGVRMTPVDELRATTDFKLRVPTNAWHTGLVPLIRVLEKNNTDCWGDSCQLTPTAIPLSDGEI